ncbi:MAG: hypothetical protein ABIK64_07595, partial [Bacillota bacterium]
RRAYTLDVLPWARAGWTDFSVQVDNQLTTGLKTNAIGGLRLKFARMAMKEYNPLSKVTGALRQREESDTVKAVVMARPAAVGRFVVAIGFMGTGTRFYDWFSNFRAGSAGGYHKGFYQLTQAFVKNEAQILFPETAEALGQKKLTLHDILTEMQEENSRFSLWMAGHSQGAAVMQVYCDRLLREKNVRQACVFGCGFASPTVAADNAAADGGAYPLYHVLNAGDLVVRMGSLKHFGLCLQYTPDAKFRDLAYGWSQTAADRCARRDAERLTLFVTDMPSFLLAFTALLTVVCEEKSDDAIFGGSEGLLSIAPIGKVFSFAGKKAKGTLRGMIAYMQKTYQEICGRGMDEPAVVFLMERFRPIVKSMPLRRLFGALYDRLYPPHSLCREAAGNGAYLKIVNERSKRLTPFLWQDDAGARPHKRFAKAFYTFDALPPVRRPRPRMRRASPRRRTLQVRR